MNRQTVDTGAYIRQRDTLSLVEVAVRRICHAQRAVPEVVCFAVYAVCPVRSVATAACRVTDLTSRSRRVEVHRAFAVRVASDDVAVCDVEA